MLNSLKSIKKEHNVLVMVYTSGDYYPDPPRDREDVFNRLQFYIDRYPLRGFIINGEIAHHGNVTQEVFDKVIERTAIGKIGVYDVGKTYKTTDKFVSKSGKPIKSIFTIIANQRHHNNVDYVLVKYRRTGDTSDIPYEVLDKYIQQGLIKELNAS